jgi:hypothetical protein
MNAYQAQDNYQHQLDEKAHAYDAALQARIDEIVMECWAQDPQGDYSLEEMIEHEADALAPLMIKIAKHDTLFDLNKSQKKLNKLMRERLAVYAQPIAEMELEGWR